MRRFQRDDGFQAQIAANTVFHMHNQITGGKAVNLAQEIIGLLAFAGL